MKKLALAGLLLFGLSGMAAAATACCIGLPCCDEAMPCCDE